MMSKFVRLAALLMLSVVVAACSGDGGNAGDPVDTAKNFMAAFAEMDSAKIAPLLCNAQKAQAEDMTSLMGEEGLEVKIDVSGLTYEAANVTDTSATVNVDGVMKISIMGQDVDQPVTDMFASGLPMVKEDGAWKLCDPAA